MSHPTSNRSSTHKGQTARKSKDSIEIVYDAELKDLTICNRIVLAMTCCTIFDTQRSYLYLRENSLETNVSLSPCCGYCGMPDIVNVNYFDKAPYAGTVKCAPFPFCFVLHCSQPKLEVVKPGCLVCFVPVNICGDSVVAYMPFENFPFPCCCFPNRVGPCDNCFGCCGPVTGNPKIYSAFFPQPTDAEGFVAVAQPIMLGNGGLVSKV